MAGAASTAHEANAASGGSFTPAEVDLRGFYGGGLVDESPAARPSWVGRTRAAIQGSVWAPVALKLLGLALGMLALASVGIASILAGVGGVPVPLAGMTNNDIHAAWLASKPAPSSSAGNASRAPAPANSAQTTASAVATAAPVATVAATTSAGMTEDGKVILNLATVEDLRHLPGIGAKRADAILSLRARLGRFKHVNELLRVKGIGVKGLKKLLPHIVLDAAKPAV
ncbi:MAG TPA: helix-hairpin-helix domain-containing protein [Polyangiaceae bacterium]